MPSSAGADQQCLAAVADAIATQTDMFARPQMSENKGQNTGQVRRFLSYTCDFLNHRLYVKHSFSYMQPSQQKPPGNGPESGAALASSGAAEKGGMPGADPADENSRMQRSTSGSMSAAGPGSKASN